MTSRSDSMSMFDEVEIRAAEHTLVRALESPDQTAWVYLYTEDAVFVAPSAPAVQGRAALLEMAEAMTPLSSVSIKPEREAAALPLSTRTDPGLAGEFQVSGRSPTFA